MDICPIVAVPRPLQSFSLRRGENASPGRPVSRKMASPFPATSAPMHPPVKMRAALALLMFTPVLHAQVRITELHASSNERFLRWDAAGQPRLGTGPAWFD